MALGLGLNLGLTKASGLASFFTQFPGAAAGYSMRQLSSGTAIARVRRAIDDTEQDVTSPTAALNFAAPADIQALYSNRMYFDGVDDYIETGYSITASTSLQISFDFVNGAQSTDNTIMGAFSNVIQGTADQRCIFLRAETDGRLRILTNATGLGAGNTSYYFNTDLNDGDIHSLVFTYTTGTGAVTLTDNGVSISGTGSTATSLFNSNITFKIGNFGDTGSSFTGILSNVTIVDDATTITYNGYGITNTDWEDQVGSVDGTVNGSPALFTGQGYDGFATIWYDQTVPTNGSVAYFDGSTSGVDFSAALIPLTADFTLTYHTAIPSGYTSASNEYAVSQYTSAVTGRSIIGVNTSGQAFVSITGNNITGSAINDGNDHEIKLTRVGSTFELFIDNVSQGTTTYAGSIENTNTEIGRTSNISRFYTGSIWDVNIDSAHAYTGTETQGVWTDTIGSENGTLVGSLGRASITDVSSIASDAMQTTTANQPYIVEDGALINEGGRASIKFDSSGNQYLEAPDDFWVGATNATAFHVNAPAAAAAADTNSAILWGWGDLSSPTFQALASASSTGGLSGEYMAFFFDNGSTRRLGSSTYTRAADTQNLLTHQLLSSGTTIYYDGAAINLNLTSGMTTGTNASPNATGYAGGGDKFIINGFVTGGTITEGPEANHQELILYGSDQSANRTDIENNINAYFGIY